MPKKNSIIYSDSGESDDESPPTQHHLPGKQGMGEDVEDEDDDEEQLELHEDDQQNCPKRAKRPTDKQKANDMAHLEAERHKLAAMKKRIAQMEAGIANAPSSAPWNPQTDDGFESEEDTYSSNALPATFSSSIRELLVAVDKTVTNKENRTPLRRFGAAARKPVPQVSSNAFRTLPPVATSLADTDDVDSWPACESSLAAPGPLLPVTNSDHNIHSTPQVVRPVVLPVEKRPHPDSSSLPTDAPPSKKAKGLTPQYRNGAEIKQKKPKAVDYEDVVQALILRAASEYECLVATQNAFPDTSTRNKWARKAWKNACAAAGEHYEMTDQINTLLRKRGSHIRGHAVTEIRKLIANAFGFKWGTDAKAKAFNCDLVMKLINPAMFHYKDLETKSGYMQGKIISEAIHTVWFEDKTSQGVIFEYLFNPIPFETLALLMTVIDFCINEWSTGTRVKASFWEKGAVEKHQAFRTDLEHWESLNPAVVQGIQKKYYMRASRCAGVMKEATVQPNLTGEAADRARDELEGRTGETDSEDETQEADE